MFIGSTKKYKVEKALPHFFGALPPREECPMLAVQEKRKMM
jgi:hypothetical protein